MKLKQDVESSWKSLFVSANEGKSGAQQAFCNVKSLSLFLRVGRFVDAKEGKSECQLCERGGRHFPHPFRKDANIVGCR